MTVMSTDFVFTNPTRFNWGAIKDLGKIIIYPDPNEDDLFNAKCSTDHLSSQGYDIPVDDEDAYRFALSVFKDTVAYSEWKQGFEPDLTVFWPCVPAQDNQVAANSIYEAGLNCVLISGNIDDVTNISGFALTGGGIDLSDHLAAAYLCSGNIPPVTVTQRALSLNRVKKMEQSLMSAAEKTSNYLVSTINNLNQVMDIDTGFRLQP